MSTISPVLDRLDKNLDQSLERLFGLLRIKSISTDSDYAADCRKAAEWLVAELKLIGFDASVRDTPGHPMVVAHHEGPAGSPHVLFYGHYDVQPVDPIGLWENDPFAPAVKEIEPGHKVITGRVLIVKSKNCAMSPVMLVWKPNICPPDSGVLAGMP